MGDAKRSAHGRGYSTAFSIIPGMMLSIAGLEERVVQVSSKDVVTYANTAAADFLGVEKARIIGAPLAGLDEKALPPGTFTGLIERVRKLGEPIEIEETLKDGAGKTTYLRIVVSPLETGSQILIQDTTKYRKLETTFKRYVSPAVIEKMKVMEDDFFAADRYELTVLFADLRGFTPTCEGMTAPQVNEMVNAFLATAIETIDGYEGTIDKIIGDCVMALFGAPIRGEDHAYRAVRAAVEMQKRHKLLVETREAGGRCMPHIGIGIHTGEMIVGNIGTESRMDYTVLGHNVNLASRMCGLAGPGEIVLSRRVHAVLDEYARKHPDAIDTRLKFYAHGEHKVKGVTEKIEALIVKEA